MSRAVRSIVENSPHHDHALLAVGGDLASEMGGGRFKSVGTLPNGLLQRVIAVRTAVASLRPAAVHAHSSWAGVYSRVLPLPVPVLYQPHGYAFEMAGVARRILFTAAERFLSPNTSKVVVLTPHESDLARRVSPGTEQVLVPNVPTVPVIVPDDRRPVPTGSPKIVMAGRLCAQKDPAYFAELARRVRQVIPRAHFLWIGGGEDQYLQRFEEERVEVTGWLGRDQLLEELDSADLYVHTATYEGFALSALDAAARGLPVVARAIPAFDGTPVLQAKDLAAHTELTLSVLQDGGSRDDALGRSSEMLRAFNSVTQNRATTLLYGDVAQRNRDDRVRGERK